ncbi:MAG: hypothetical protein ACOYMN_26440, partial [Roseimicrobium sp.]
PHRPAARPHSAHARCSPPVLDAIAAASDDATRFPPERTDALFRHFTKVGASGELNALSKHLTLGAKQKEQMVRQRLDEWLGKGVGTVKVQRDGNIEVKNLPKATDTLEPLRELRELQKVRISDLKYIKVSLEPLRQHTSLQYIAVGGEGPYRPVAEFWADYDAQQARGRSELAAHRSRLRGRGYA